MIGHTSDEPHEPLEPIVPLKHFQYVFIRLASCTKVSWSLKQIVGEPISF